MTRRNDGLLRLLRRAHMRPIVAPERDPRELAVRALTAPERRLANAFAVSRRSMPLDLLMRLPGPELARSLQTLLTRRIVDRRFDGTYQMHEPWRQAVARDLDSAGRRVADEDLVAALSGSTLDPLVKVQEMSWHLRSLGLHADGGVVPRAADCAVIDGIHHEIRVGARRIPLRARPVSRQLLYAFAAAPSQYLARNTIARTLWASDYDPLRHESTLKSNIRRLRMLLAGFAELSSEPGGYRIVLPDSVEFIPPVVTGQPPPGS